MRRRKDRYVNEPGTILGTWLPPVLLALAALACGDRTGIESEGGGAPQRVASLAAGTDVGASSVLSFRVESESWSDPGALVRGNRDETTGTSGPVGGDTASLRVTGRVRRLGLSSGPEERASLIQLEFSSIDLTMNGVSLEQYASSLDVDARNPFYVTIDPEGRVDSLYFSPASSGAFRQFASLLASYLQVVVPDSARGDAWSARESDTQGILRADYSIETLDRRDGTRPSRRFRIVRSKTGYLVSDLRRFKGALDLEMELRPRGHTVAWCSSAAPGIDSLAADERFESVIAGRVISWTKTRVALSAASSNRWPDVPWKERADEFRRLRKHLSSKPIYAPASAKDALQAANEAALGEDTVPGLLETLERSAGLVSADSLGVLYRKLKAGLYLHPEACGLAADVAGGVECDPTVVNLVVKALAEAGTPECQTVLVKLAGTAVAPRTRNLAISELGLVETPTGESATELARLAKEDDLEVSTTAILAQGNIAGQLFKHDAGRSAMLTEQLVGELGRAGDETRRTAYLLALGNAGHPGGLAAVASACRDASPGIRRAAVIALRFIPGEEPDRLLVDALLEDPEPQVQERAAAAMSYRAPVPRIIQAHIAALQRDRTELVCLAVLKNIGRWLPEHPELKEAVERAASHPIENVQKTARHLLETSQN